MSSHAQLSDISSEHLVVMNSYKPFKRPGSQKAYTELEVANVVHIWVGPDETHEYIIHKDLLMHRVPFFRIMFGGDFTEGRENAAHLLEDNPKVFELFFKWLYSLDMMYIKGRNMHQFVLLTDLYIFAEKYDIEGLRDRTITGWIKCIARWSNIQRHILNFETIELLYLSTPKGSKIRKFIASDIIYDLVRRRKCYSDYTDSDVGTEYIYDFLQECPEALQDVLNEMSGMCLGGLPLDPREVRDCQFHSHKEIADSHDCTLWRFLRRGYHHEKGFQI